MPQGMILEAKSEDLANKPLRFLRIFLNYGARIGTTKKLF